MQSSDAPALPIGAPGPPGSAGPADVHNEEVAAIFDRVADLLEVGDASTWRVRAYRRGADALRRLDRPIEDLYAEQGHEGLVELPAIGERLAGAIEEILRRGTFGLLGRLEGTTTPEDLIASVPGVGPVLASRIHDTLGVETLEELELAAHDGRLERVEGIGPRRIRALRGTLDSMLRRSGRRRARARAPLGGEVPRPSVATLLEVDAEYRRRAEAGELRRITPRRFNPEHEAWLPIWHTERDGWQIDAMYSNTARAHDLGRTHDWVVIYFDKAGTEGQCTVVTERPRGRPGRRVVRGYEEASRAVSEANAGRS